MSEEQSTTEEGHYFWTLGKFEELIDIYGADKVVKDLDEDVKNALFKALLFDGK